MDPDNSGQTLGDGAPASEVDEPTPRGESVVVARGSSNASGGNSALKLGAVAALVLALLAGAYVYVSTPPPPPATASPAALTPDPSWRLDIYFSIEMISGCVPDHSVTTAKSGSTVFMAVHSGSLRGIPVEVTITKDGKPFYGTAGWVVDRCPEASLDQLPGWGPGKYHVTAKQENNAAEADFTVE